MVALILGTIGSIYGTGVYEFLFNGKSHTLLETILFYELWAFWLLALIWMSKQIIPVNNFRIKTVVTPSLVSR